MADTLESTLESTLTIPRRGGVAAPFVMELGRELTASDLLLLAQSPLIAVQPIKQARAIHHKQAQLIAEGRFSYAEIAAIVGTTPQRIVQLQSDPTFIELVEFYRSQHSDIEFETWARLQGQLVDVFELSLTEIQSRLSDDEVRAKLPLKELRSLAEFSGDRSVAPPRATQQGSATPPTKIELNFGFKAPPEAVPEPKIVEHSGVE